MSARICPDCHGARLKPESLAVTVGERNIVQITNLSIVLAQRFFKDLEAEATVNAESAISFTNGSGNGQGKNGNGNPVKSDPYAKIDLHEPLVLVTLTERERFIARQVLKEIRARLQFLVDVGLEYLTLERAAGSLSGGEAQRIRLATQIGSGLMGVLYILDGPSIGPYELDYACLLKT